MTFKKIILNLLVFSILIGGFVYAYFKFDKIAEATTLVFCVKNDFTNYITIDSDHPCPVGYFPAPADFNLNLLQQATSTLNLGDIYALASSTNQNSTSSPDNSYNNATSSSNPNGYYDQNGVFHPYVINTGNNLDPTYNSPSYPSQEYNPYPINNNSIYTPPVFNSGDMFAVNPNPIIQIDEALAHGRFETLDPRDYEFCVLLTHNLTLGYTDANTGEEVSALQMYLYDRGYANTPPNGTYDTNTALAVKRFQYRNQIEVSGIVKADLRSLLQDLTCVKYPVVTYKAKLISPAPKTVRVTPTVSRPIISNKTTTAQTTIPKTTVPKKVVKEVVPDKSDSSSDLVDLNLKNTEGETTNKVVIPSTNLAPTDNSETLSPISGNMYLSTGNRLYFTYTTEVKSPYICISLSETNCEDTLNYAPVYEGMMMGLYEAVNFNNFWAFNLYNGSAWGKAGDKVRIYLKDSLDSKSNSVYIVNLLN